MYIYRTEPDDIYVYVYRWIRWIDKTATSTYVRTSYKIKRRAPLSMNTDDAGSRYRFQRRGEKRGGGAFHSLVCLYAISCSFVLKKEKTVPTYLPTYICM